MRGDLEAGQVVIVNGQAAVVLDASSVGVRIRFRNSEAEATVPAAHVRRVGRS